jgi:hypothetical protein
MPFRGASICNDLPELACYSCQSYTLTVEEARLKTLNDLLGQATQLQAETTKLVAEITDQLQRSIFTHDDRSGALFRPKPDRRRTPRHK